MQAPMAPTLGLLGFLDARGMDHIHPVVHCCRAIKHFVIFIFRIVRSVFRGTALDIWQVRSCQKS